MPTTNTDTMAKIITEKARITQRLAQAEVQVATLAGQLAAFDSVESMITGTGSRAPKKQTAIPALNTPSGVPKRGRPAKSTTTPKRARTPPDQSLSTFALQAVAQQPGRTTSQVTTYIKDRYGIPARPNHVGAALARHLKAGRLTSSGTKKNQLWYEPTAIPMQRTG